MESMPPFFRPTIPGSGTSWGSYESNPPRPITSAKVLAVEGADEVKFFSKLFVVLGVRDCDIREVGGKNQFPTKLPALKLTRGFVNPDGSPHVTHLAIVRDHDEDSAFESIASILRKAGFVPPRQHAQFSDGVPSVGIFIMPGAGAEGAMLEDLCLKSVEDHPAMTCVREFGTCVQKLQDGPKNMSKAMAQAYLATRPESDCRTGIGAEKGYWNLERPCFEELRRFLSHLK